MLVIVGYVLVAFSVFGGFALAGGSMGALLQPVELMMIGGAAVGSFIVSNSSATIKATLNALPSLMKGIKYNKESYMELLALLYDLLGKVRKQGLMSIENDVENPYDSPFFNKYPKILHDRHVVEFITDYLRIMLSGNLNAMEIENLLDLEIETIHHEAMEPSHVIAELGQAFPAFGIVAAVMGVVITMESVSLPPEELGILIARALVGTFLGILLAYGFVNPIGILLSQKAEETNKMLLAIKVTLLANLNGYAPAMAVEFGRKALYLSERPGFIELETHIKTKR
jgi:chemotaxis protein MotA